MLQNGSKSPENSMWAGHSSKSWSAPNLTSPVILREEVTVEERPQTMNVLLIDVGNESRIAEQWTILAMDDDLISPHSSRVGRTVS
jgi:hypothetical protein